MPLLSTPPAVFQLHTTVMTIKMKLKNLDINTVCLLPTTISNSTPTPSSIYMFIIITKSKYQYLKQK